MQLSEIFTVALLRAYIWQADVGFATLNFGLFDGLLDR